MIKKILILATVTASLLICGCDQELPTAPKTENPKVQVQPDNPEAVKPAPEKPQNNPEPTEQTKPNEPTEPAKPNEPPAPPTPETPDKKSATETQKTMTPPEKTSEQSQKISLRAYFPDDAGINLVAVNRTIEVKNDAEKYLAAVELLMTYPGEKDLTVIFPKNTKLNGVSFKSGTVYVDFDENITKSFVGGSTGEELLVGSVVKTLTEFKEVQQVRFLVDGQEIETLSGHMDLSEPVKRDDL